MDVTQWKNLGLTYTGNILNLQGKKKMGREEEKGRERKQTWREEKHIGYLTHLWAKIADKINLKNKGFI